MGTPINMYGVRAKKWRVGVTTCICTIYSVHQNVLFSGFPTYFSLCVSGLSHRPSTLDDLSPNNFGSAALHWRRVALHCSCEEITATVCISSNLLFIVPKIVGWWHFQGVFTFSWKPQQWMNYKYPRNNEIRMHHPFKERLGGFYG